MTKTSGRVAVVTGAGGGLGRAVALRLAARGHAVACSDIQVEHVESVVEEISAAGGQAHAAEVDISSPESVEQWRSSLTPRLGPASILCNVAGTLDRRMAEEVTLDDFMKVVTTNLGGTYNCIRTFLPDLKSADWARIINIASISAVRGYPYPSYGSSKAGMLGLMNSLLVDLWGTSVTINSVCPGAMETPMLNHDAIEQMKARTPAGRIASPDHVAAVVDFLAGPEAALVNGASVVVDGGATAVFRYFD